jgi:hypothetical protein
MALRRGRRHVLRRHVLALVSRHLQGGRHPRLSRAF